MVQFTTTQNAAEADIFIFFVNVLSDKRSGCCLYPYEAGEPNIIEIALSEFKEGEFKEAWTKIEPAVAAHEIGHAFGLDHSADKGDMMYDHEILNLDGEGGLTLTRQVTDNDKAALRALYSKPAKYWMVSVKSGK